ncbi:hypothetical protein ABL840_09175 [Variovorax sp. NFACC27]|uniref:phage neck terminator protein n=1 Tax=unclassified Variovorax TaxID=663243 RepID=UPI0008942A01|nr:hypothetical protein SAMN03159371_05263 [Variovorax sp. NFACC28]SEG89692.1 hypothetical protein SAMN03159365_05184 [Variovorax sp. NFACC29]SFD40100.1 hypothetical protein SAMN03159379_05153 [Variovorax sp. NFACC26]SFG42398.1 hypothetical protein SAMN03159447_03263 [Variovorax sp. NFACC27]
MTATITPAQADMFVVLQAFIMDVLGLDMDHVVQGIGNGVPMPLGGFVAMTELFQNRLATNVSSYSDPTPTTGTKDTTQATQVTVQLDCYGPNSGDWASILSTMLRDDYGCDALAPAAQPLHADDPKMVPLVNGEEQYEQRWTITALLQINPVVSTPMQFFDQANVGVVEIDTHFPP